MRLFMVLLIGISLTGCFEAPLKHDHKVYNYEIKYGQDRNNLDQSLTAQCTEYYHDQWDENSCNKSTDQIDNYICAVDGRLYLKSTSRNYKSVSTAVISLDNIYCQINETSINIFKYEY